MEPFNYQSLMRCARHSIAELSIINLYTCGPANSTLNFACVASDQTKELIETNTFHYNT